MTPVGIVVGMVLVGTLSGLFIYKLCKLPNNNQKNKDLTSTAIKAFLLTLMSIISAVLFALVLILRNESVSYLIVFGFCYLMDICTNFVSVMFGYKSFDSHYMRICAKCHEKSMRFEKKMPSKKDEVKLRVQQLTPTDSTSGKVSP